MIKVTRFNGKEFYLNGEIIEFVEATPDTVITTTTGKKVVVKESVAEVVDEVIAYKNKIFKYNE